MLFLLFTIGTDRYAIASKHVVRVIPALSVRPIPGSPPEVAGVCFCEGKSIPVIDVSLMVSGTPVANQLGTRFLLLELKDGTGKMRSVALAADQVTETLTIGEDAWQASGVADADRRFLGPVSQIGNLVVQRVEPDELMSEAVQRAIFT